MFCACNLQAQNFNVAERFGLFTITLTGVEDVNNNYYFIGYGQDSINPLRVHGYFIKYSQSGKFKFIMQFDDTSGIDTFTDFEGIKWDGENFVVSGHVEGTGNANKISLLKIDTNGNYSQPKIFNDSINRNQYSNKLLISKKNTYIIGGVQEQNFEINIRIIKLDNNFFEVWKKDFGVTGKTDRSYSATQLPNGNIVVGAHRYDAQKVNGTRYQEQTWIFEIDTAGNMVREFLDPDTQTGPAKGITQSQDGGFVYCGKYQSNWNGKVSYKWQGSIAKLKSDFSMKEWEHKVTDTLSSIISMENVKSHKDKFVAVGQDLSKSEVKPEEISISGVLIRFSESGEIQWQRNFRGLDSTDEYYYNYLFDLDISEKDEIISCGYSNRFSGPNNGWILKLDSTGCLTEDYCGVPSLSIIEPSMSSKIELYPNPFTSELIIENKSGEKIQEIAIYNLMGSLVYTATNSSKTLQLSHLPNGLYFLKLQTENGEWVSQKVVKY